MRPTVISWDLIGTIISLYVCSHRVGKGIPYAITLRIHRLCCYKEKKNLVKHADFEMWIVVRLRCRMYNM